MSERVGHDRWYRDAAGRIAVISVDAKGFVLMSEDAMHTVLGHAGFVEVPDHHDAACLISVEPS